MAIAYLVATFSLTHSLTHSGLFKLVRMEPGIGRIVTRIFRIVTRMAPYGLVWTHMVPQGPVRSLIIPYDPYGSVGLAKIYLFCQKITALPS